MILHDCSVQNDSTDADAEDSTTLQTPYAEVALISARSEKSNDSDVILCSFQADDAEELDEIVDVEQNLATNVHVDDLGNDLKKPFAVATVVPSDPETFHDVACSNLSVYANAHATRRAEFISATVIKTSRSSSLGLEIEMSTYTPQHMQANRAFPCFRITRIKDTSLLSTSPFQPRDRLVSINGKPCFFFRSTEEVNHFLNEEVTGTVTIICEDEQGQANYVESMVEKSTPEALLGIVFMRKHGKLFLKDINEDSVCSSTLLNAGDRLVAVNSVECQNEHAHTIAEWVHNSPRYVTFLTETQRSKAVVVAAASFLYGPSISGSAVGSLSRHSHQDTRSAEFYSCGLHPILCCMLVMVVVIFTFTMISMA